MRRSWKALAMGIVGALPVVVAAQAPFSDPKLPKTVDAPILGGNATIDFVRLSGDRPNVPLRFGGVLAGSEHVELDGKVLRRGVDYQIDNGGGMIYLATPIRPGQSLMVRYRYDKAKEAPVGSAFAGVGSFKMELVPSALRMVVGLGITERSGSEVLNSNLFGWNNTFKFAGGSLSGLYLLGDRERQQTRSAYEFVAAGPKPDTGKSHFMLQNYAAKVAGGTIEANYQDISKNFAGFGAAADNGVAAAQVQQLQKEKGLTRVGLNMKEVDLGGFKLSNSFKTVGENGSDISWRSLGLGFGGFGFTWGSQVVDKGFKRFNDLAEGDRGQLAKEAGMSRNWYGLSYGAKGVKTAFNFSNVVDPADHGISQRSFSLDSSMLKLSLGSQKVDRGFSRIGSLPDPERNRLTREIGTEREWYDFTSNALKTGGDPLKISQSKLSNDAGSFTSQNISAGGKTWKVEHSERGASSGFSGFGAMQDAERNDHVKAITNMYQAGGFAPNGNDIGRFMGSQGIEHSLTRLSLTPSKGLQTGIDLFRISAPQGSANVETINVAAKTLSLGFRKQTMSDDFLTLNTLMDFERARLGTIVGLDKTDLTANMGFGKGGKLAFSQMNADSPTGGADRRSINIQNGPLSLAYNQRSVDDGFGSTGQLVDPERDLLTTLRGFRESDLNASWQFAPNLKFSTLMFDANSDSLDQARNQRRIGIDYSPNKLTTINLVRYQAKNDSAAGLLFGNVLDQFSFSRNLGKSGTFSYFRETQTFDGVQTLNTPDSQKERFSYETKLNAKTSFKTEQQTTKFDNGDKENVNANTLSTEISKRATISVTDVVVDRNGTERDERKKVYGFGFDLGNGLKILYGMQRQEVNGKGTENSQVNVSPGSIGNLQVNQAIYNEQQADDLNTRSQGNVQLQTKKPFSLGFVKDLQLNASLDTLADRSKWQKQNKEFSISGKIGSNAFLYGYKGQIHPTGYHAIDRYFSFVTDQSEKKPLVANLQYKLRTLPWDEQIMIRNFSITARPTKNIEIVNQMLTNPTADRPDQLLGSVVQASRMNRWKINFKGTGNVLFGGQWDEIMDKAHPRQRTAGINMTLNAKSPSPIKLFYGLEQADANNRRRTSNRYTLQFDQRPGPNQMFSLFLGNVNYDYSIVDGKRGDNWTVRLDWQIRF